MTKVTINNAPVSTEINESLSIPADEVWDVTIIGTDVSFNEAYVGDGTFKVVLDDTTTIYGNGRVSGFVVR